MAYSSHYETIANIPVAAGVDQYATYSISYSGNIIYTGRVYNDGNTAKNISVDISSICRAYLQTYYENIITTYQTVQNVPIVNGQTTIGVFTVTSGSYTASFTIAYNYNDTYTSTIPDAQNINLPIVIDADPRQLITLSGYSLIGSDSYSYSVNGGAATTSSLSSQVYHNLSLNLSMLGVSNGDTVNVSNNGVSTTYNIVDSCNARYAIYYVNKLGGLDCMLCSGRSVESFQPSRTDIERYNVRTNRLDWEAERIYQDVRYSYELNTGFLPDDRAGLIDNLIYTRKAFLHDLEEDTITTCLIDTSGYSIRKFYNDGMVQYDFVVYLSQKMLRL